MQASEEIVQALPGARTSRKLIVIGAIITVAVTALFFLLYWNRFLGLRSGDGSYGGGLSFLAGLRPYRDYFSPGPPLNQLISAIPLAIFGKQLIVMRGFGVFERLLVAVLLYFWLIRLFRARDAAIGSIMATILSAGDPSSILPSYGIEAILFLTLSGFAATLAFDRLESLRSFVLLAIASGVFAALSLGTKQTLGVGATLGIPFMGAIYVFRKSGLRKSVIFVASFAAGWLLVFGALLLWLRELGAFREFGSDVFKKGPAAKASHPIDFVVRALHAAWQLRWQFFAACAAVLALWPAFRRSGTNESIRSEQNRSLWLICLLGAGSIAFGAAASYAGLSVLAGLPVGMVFFTEIGLALLLLVYAVLLIRGNLSERQSQLCFLVGTAFVSTFMVALSWPASFDLSYPGTGVLIAAALDGSKRFIRYAAYGICSLTLLGATCAKLNLPHGFHEWVEPPVRLANTHSSLPQLAGLVLPETTVRFVDGTVRIIKEHSSPQETIFSYPELGLFYTLGNRRYPTLTPSHNIDVVTDDLARSEAQRLLDRKPAVLIYYRQPELSLHADEVLWRRGKRSGQRDLIAAMETLAKEYRLAAAFDVPPNEFPVMVYVRR